MSVNSYTAGFDGSATPNPGEMKIGGWIKKDGKVIFEFQRSIGTGTNNAAEYAALLALVKEAQRRNIQSISIKGDSQLIINQVNGVWKAKKPTMKYYRNKVLSVLKNINDWELIHVVRKHNKEADNLTRF